MAHHDVENTARFVASKMADGDADCAVRTLRDEANNMNPMEFRALINRTSQMDPKGDGVDLQIVSQPVGRDACGRILNEDVVGISAIDRDGDRHFYPVASLGTMDRRYSCDGGRYYDETPRYPVPRPGIDPRFDPRFQRPVPMYDPYNRQIFRGVPTPHRGGGIQISPYGVEIDIPLGR